MKLALTLTLSLLVGGCGLIKPPPKTSPLAAAATARLSDVKSEASSMAEELNTSTVVFSDNLDELDALIAELRETLPQMADRFAGVAVKMRTELVKQQAIVARQRVHVTKIASVQTQVDKLTKDGEAKDARIAELEAAIKDADRASVKWVMPIGIALLMGGFVLLIGVNRLLGIGVMGAGGIGVAASIFVPRIQDVAPIIVYSMAGIALVAFAYVVFKYVKSKQALKQVVTGATILTKTLEAQSPAQAALATYQLQGTQDKTTSDVVNEIKKTLDPDMLKKAVEKAAVVSALPEMTQATVASPGVAATGSPAGTATIQSGPLTTMTGPAVAPVVVPVPAPQVVYVPTPAPAAPAVPPVQPGQQATIGVGAGATVEGTVVEAGPKPPGG